jgi:hypothetical protein
MAWTCAEARLLLGKLYDEEAFSADVRRYCGVVLDYHGLSAPPSTLVFADMPRERYPDTALYADETLFSAWAETQDALLADIDDKVKELAASLADQLLAIRPFAENKEPFSRLRTASGRVREPSSAAEPT